MDVTGKKNALGLIDLLKYPKTKRVAVRCLIYIAQAFVPPDPNCPRAPHIEIRKMTKPPKNADQDNPVHHEGTSVIWEKNLINLSVPKPPENGTFDANPFPAEKLSDYAELLKEAMNALLTEYEEDGTWTFRTFLRAIEHKVANFKKPIEDSAYKMFEVPEDTNKIIQSFDQFIDKEGPFTKEMAQIFLSAFCSVSENLHFFAHTPLHITILNNDLDVLIMLLSNCEEIELEARNDDGLTPLQLTVKNSQPIFAKALILFGADVDKERMENMKLASDKMKILEAMRRIVGRAERIPGPKTHLLSLDGGGIRGLVLTTVLAEIQAVIGGNIVDRFQFMAGSSTGAILAVALAQGKSIAQCRNIYFRLKDVVFYRKSSASPYSHETLEQFLDIELNGKDCMSTLREESGKFVIVTSCDTSKKPMQTVLFKSYKLKGELDDGTTLPDIGEETIHSLRPQSPVPSDPGMTDSNESLYEDDKWQENKRMNGDVVVEESNLRRVGSTETAVFNDDTETELTYEERTRMRRERRFFKTYCRVHTYYRRNDVFDDSSTMIRSPNKTAIRYATRCSSAAPTYFASPDENEAHQDGGVINNNPAEILLEEFTKVNNAYEDNLAAAMTFGVLLSIGTGRKKAKDSKRCLPTCGAQVTSNVVNLGLSFKGEIARSDGPVVGQSMAHAQALGGLGLRFSPLFEDKIGLDETKNETLINMMWTTKVYMRDERWKGKLRALEAILKQ